GAAAERACISDSRKRASLGRDAPVASVFLRQEDGCGGAVGFGDDPDSRAVRKRVGRQDAETFPDGKLILAPVFFIEFAPVAGNMAAYKWPRLLASAGQRIYSARCRD